VSLIFQVFTAFIIYCRIIGKEHREKW